MPTYPNSLLSGIILITLFSLGDIEQTFVFLDFNSCKISKLSSNKASSIYLIVFSSEILSPLINLVSIFFSSNFFLIFLPPPWTTIADKPILFITEISSMNWLNSFFSNKTDPPHLITITSDWYLFIYFSTSLILGPSFGIIYLIPSIKLF